MKGWAFFLLASLGCAGEAQDFTPIATRNFRPYSLLFLRFEPSGSVLGSGQRQFETDFTAANSFTFVPNRLFAVQAEEDIEVDRLSLRYSQGLGKGFEFSGETSLEAVGPGFLDPIISWYHHTFLRLHTLRDSVPFGGHTVFSPSGGPFSGGFGFGDTSLFIAKDLGHGGLVRAGVKLPTGNPIELLGSGGVDAGIYAQKQLRLGRKWCLTLDGGVIAQGVALRLQNVRPWVTQEGFTFAYAPDSRDTWLFQAGYESSPVVEGIESLDKVHASSTFGYRRRLDDRDSLTFYFTEDIDPLNPNFPVGSDVGPDFVIGITWTRKV